MTVGRNCTIAPAGSPCSTCAYPRIIDAYARLTRSGACSRLRRHTSTASALRPRDVSIQPTVKPADLCSRGSPISLPTASARAAPRTRPRTRRSAHDSSPHRSAPSPATTLVALRRHSRPPLAVRESLAVSPDHAPRARAGRGPFRASGRRPRSRPRWRGGCSRRRGVDRPAGCTCARARRSRRR